MHVGGCITFSTFLSNGKLSPFVTMVGGSAGQLRPYGSKLMDLTSFLSPPGSENSTKIKTHQGPLG